MPNADAYEREVLSAFEKGIIMAFNKDGFMVDFMPEDKGLVTDALALIT